MSEWTKILSCKYSFVTFVEVNAEPVNENVPEVNPRASKGDELANVNEG